MHSRALSTLSRRAAQAAAGAPTPAAAAVPPANPGFRTEFSYDKAIFWYPSHQTKALRQLKDGIHHIDVVVEVRDARIPVTSINRQFDGFLASRERIVVYNKCDLANSNMRKPLTDALREYRNEEPIFTTANKGMHVKKILEAAIEKCKVDPERFPYLSMIVVGIPNVGKSSLINALRHLGVRKGKVTAVGKLAGVTTAIQTRVKIFEDPPIYLVDTPGIFDPHVSTPIEGLKISLTGKLSASPYPSILGLPEPTDQIFDVLKHICRQQRFFHNTKGRMFNLSAPPSLRDGAASALRDDDLESVPDFALDTDQAARYLLDKYREGVFGPLTLDDCSPESLKQALTDPRFDISRDADKDALFGSEDEPRSDS
ncbi:Mitochondrial GTPase 1 [Polyrhizophydium stewartii]|uniref:Mitochondrial GTPase 1 n=1 Tax=Polyrhizophydium stewartii TaxID=2732419 RepID=A0ABR4N082_9FUNG|nr:Mitochondrial GTPase [Polyrhizophydium stewartii]